MLNLYFYADEQSAKKARSDSLYLIEDSNVHNACIDEFVPELQCKNVESAQSTPQKILDDVDKFKEIESEEIPQENKFNELQKLKEWAAERNIDYVALDELLLILRQRLLPELPKTSKTFLNLNFNYHIKKIENDNQEMSYVYFGLEGSLLNVINPDLHKNNQIDLQFNVDSMSLFKSSNVQFWPILVKVFDEFDSYQPFVLGILQSEGKPDNAEQFLNEFVNDMNKLLESGLNMNERKFEIHIKCFVCDTPARSFLKCTKGHGGYFACERCVVEGMRKNRRTIYPDYDADLRTDDSFRKMDSDHHTGASPLLNIIPKINMVLWFLLDFMHLACNGGMLKLILYWIKDGERRVRLSKKQQKELSRRLLLLKNCIPVEFQRKPRSLKYAAKWKATELRFFLLYCGRLVLQNLLAPDYYKHFLLFHVAFRILCSDKYKTEVHLAKSYLLKFFKAMPFLYGKQSLIMNIHNMLHVADDVINMQCNLSRVNAFPFENALGKLRKYVRTPNKPLAQVCRRLQVTKNFQKRPPTVPKNFVVLKSVKEGNCIIVNKIKIKNMYTLTDKHPNNYILTKSGKILKINKIYYLCNKANKIKISGTVLKKVRSIFTYPMKSTKLACCQVSKTKRKLLTSVNALQTKLVYLSFNLAPGKSMRSYVLPFLH